MIDEHGTRVRLSDKMTYVAPVIVTAEVRTRWTKAAEERVRLINAPFPAIMPGHVVQSAMLWSGVLIGGRYGTQTDEESKRGRRVVTRTQYVDAREHFSSFADRVLYYADHAN